MILKKVELDWFRNGRGKINVVDVVGHDRRFEGSCCLDLGGIRVRVGLIWNTDIVFEFFSATGVLEARLPSAGIGKKRHVRHEPQLNPVFPR